MDPRFRKCVFFLMRGRKNPGGKEKRLYAGTAFAVSVGLSGQQPDGPDWAGSICYAVTAAHVVKNTDPEQELYLRVNRVDGPPCDIHAPVSAWYFHATSDVAVWPIAFPENEVLDVMTIPVTNLPERRPIIGVMEGEEVMICGLLTNIPGSARIHPIVRTGKIALMPHEKIRVQIDRSTANDVDAYLLEITSWPGLSGSPVIIYPNRNPMNSRKFDYMMSFVLLGLIHGGLEIDKEVKFDRDTSTIKLGSGIAVAIPGETIHELLMESSDLKIQRMEMLEQMTAEKNPPTT